MENSMSRILVGAVVKRTLKDMKENPERSASVRTKKGSIAISRGQFPSK